MASAAMSLATMISSAMASDAMVVATMILAAMVLSATVLGDAMEDKPVSLLFGSNGGGANFPRWSTLPLLH